ncbi:membrane protein [Aureimonas sp. SA4125]|uniref:hypothetical protein n=1 Tax=Aureimonas sp. SA4125 TaxID=2826993 RepID=UPI001CC6F058|nr:hypothetical protein [Aureimonas sp. SA4125]BDA83812.1 membrane protein [Aureimonas sp. SA4125]
MTSTSSRVIASLAFVLLGSSAGLAADAQAFGDRLKELAGQSDMPISFTAAESIGENVILKGVTLGAGPEASMIGDVTFENVTGSTAEGWNVEQVPFADFNKTEEGKQATVTGMAISGLQLAGSQGASTLPGGSPIFFDEASVESVAITEGGKSLFSLSGTEWTNAVESGSGTITSNFNLGDFSLDFASLPADETTKAMQEVGYPQVAGSGSVEMSWDPKSGELSLAPFDLTVKDAGKFNFAYQINGYTPSFVQSLQQIQAQMAADPAGASNSGMALIGLVSQLSLASLEIGFADDSLTNKLLDYYAKKNGQTREQLIDQVIATLPPMLAMLQNPEFQGTVTTAVTSFLKDPKSLTISVDPDAPVAATQIIGAAMGAPQTLPQVLQLEVTANDQ